MALFIDPPAWPAHGRLWAHLVSDTSLDELHTFAADHGLPRRGFERDHYDVPAELHDALVAAGATPVSARDILRHLNRAGLRRRKSDAPARRSTGRELLRPRRLVPGDVVRVVATAGVVGEERLRAGVDVLTGWGLEVQLGDHVLGRVQELPYLAAADADRAADFTAAWSDPAVAAVVLARGGYGNQRIADLLDWRRLAESEPKLMVGFSDVTALHQAVASRLGLVTVHGHVTTSLGAATDAGAEQLRRLLFEPETVTELLPEPIRTVVPGVASGVLLGGNLTVLAAGAGTETVRAARGGIVVLEEINEQPYRIDRQLTQLLRSGWFDGVRGIVLGAFTDCGDLAVVDAVVRDRLGGLGVPVLSGADIGHTASTLPVPFGVTARLDAGAGSLVLSEPALV